MFLASFLAAKNTVICLNMDDWLSCYHVIPHKYNDISVNPSSQLLRFSWVDPLDEIGLSVWIDLGNQTPLQGIACFTAWYPEGGAKTKAGTAKPELLFRKWSYG